MGPQLAGEGFAVQPSLLKHTQQIYEQFVSFSYPYITDVIHLSPTTGKCFSPQRYPRSPLLGDCLINFGEAFPVLLSTAAPRTLTQVDAFLAVVGSIAR